MSVQSVLMCIAAGIAMGEVSGSFLIGGDTHDLLLAIFYMQVALF